MRSKIGRLGAFILISVMLLSLLASCTSISEEPSPAEVSTLPMEVIDQAGRAVRIEQIPERIISLAPSNTEIIYALHLEDRLVGVTEYCDYPEAAKEKPKIGGFSTVSIEKVVESQPDLILAANIHKSEVVPQLERLGLTVLVLDPKTIEEVLEAINLVGKFTGKKEEAEQLTSEMRDRIKAVTDKTESLPETQRPRVLYLLWHEPLMTAGAKTRIHELIVKAGGINIAQGLAGDYPTMSLEAVILANPQVIVTGSGHGSGEDLPFQFALTEPRLKDVDARRNDRLYAIDANVVSRPGPRTAEALEEMARQLHPEIFGLKK